MTKEKLNECKIKAHRLLNQYKFTEAFLTFQKDLEDDGGFDKLLEAIQDYGMVCVVNQDYNGLKNYIDGFHETE